MDLLNEFLVMLGLPVGTAGILPLIILASRAVAKYIPDDSVGVLKWVRRVAKVVGLYGKNRKTKAK